MQHKSKTIKNKKNNMKLTYINKYSKKRPKQT